MVDTLRKCNEIAFVNKLLVKLFNLQKSILLSENKQALN